MFESMTAEISNILSLSICGISLLSIFGMVIYCIRLAVKNKKILKVTTGTIEEAFKNVVLPKNIKLDISNKIEKPIKEGLIQVADKVSSALMRVEKGEQLMLRILVLFTHFQKLPEDVRAQIEDFIEEEYSTEIKI